MTYWDMDPQGVYDVLGKVGPDADKIGKDISEEKIKSLATAVVSADDNSAFQYVAQASSDLIEDQLTNVVTIQNHVTAGVLGVANALAAYCKGQHDMQDTFNSEMLKSAESGNFDYFKNHSALPQPPQAAAPAPAPSTSAQKPR